ncbi:band 7 family-domain-containing protein [Circinella umbellata]|nr:band 7 family-domain-containing protein [Circinella umbellata]
MLIGLLWFNDDLAGLVTRFGKCYKVVDPGLVKINPVTESIKRVDVTIQITDIPSQEVITKDNVSITIESVLYWRVLAPYEAEYRAEDLMTSLMERARTVLRNVCGQHSFQDLIENRDAISREIQKNINPAAQQWGVEVEATLVKDIGISKQLQQSLSSAATAKRLGESRVIASQAEVESAKLMREAADILSTPAAMQIRYLDTLTAMSRSGQGPKTIFMPMPGSGNTSSLGIQDPASASSSK